MSVNDRIRHESNTVIFEDHEEVGYNYRMTDIQAAVGIKQLEKLDWIVDERRKIAAAYHEAFKGIECMRLPLEVEGYFSNYQSYSIYLKKSCPLDRNKVMQELLNKGIASRRGVMTSHRETAYKSSHSDATLPVSEDLQDNSIIIPLFVPMVESEVRYVVNSFLKIVKAIPLVFDQEVAK